MVSVAYDRMDAFVVVRRGLRWQVGCLSARDGITRECAFGARFWRRATAQRVASAMFKVMMETFWQAGAHPLQHGAVPVAAVGGLRLVGGTVAPPAG